MDNTVNSYKKGDVVLVVKYGKINKEEISRKERNGNSFHMKNGFVAVNLKNIFPYNRQGLKDARAFLKSEIEDSIKHHKLQIEKLEKEILDPVILRIDHPGPTEKNYYTVEEDGTLSGL